MATMIALFGSFFALWTFLAWFAGAVFCSTVANAKNLNPLMWFLGGLLFPVIALIAVAGMPAQLSRHEKKLLLEKYDNHQKEAKLKSISDRATKSSEDFYDSWRDGPTKKDVATSELVVRDEKGNIITPKLKNGPPPWMIVGSLVLLVLVLWFQAK
ncbi:hypothetical protein [Advenella sp. FME57]|uniref:hypothetical protein n=1 Tax=Advenella sp. FME57 TaxID=2742604 RepID=UPI001868FD00|nr:hypothetical protein [Advenella sp. FME57]